MNGGFINMAIKTPTPSRGGLITLLGSTMHGPNKGAGKGDFAHALAKEVPGDDVPKDAEALYRALSEALTLTQNEKQNKEQKIELDSRLEESELVSEALKAGEEVRLPLEIDEALKDVKDAVESAHDVFPQSMADLIDKLQSVLKSKVGEEVGIEIEADASELPTEKKDVVRLTSPVEHRINPSTSAKDLFKHIEANPHIENIKFIFTSASTKKPLFQFELSRTDAGKFSIVFPKDPSSKNVMALNGKKEASPLFVHRFKDTHDVSRMVRSTLRHLETLPKERVPLGLSQDLSRLARSIQQHESVDIGLVRRIQKMMTELNARYKNETEPFVPTQNRLPLNHAVKPNIEVLSGPFAIQEEGVNTPKTSVMFYEPSLGKEIVKHQSTMEGTQLRGSHDEGGNSFSVAAADGTRLHASNRAGGVSSSATVFATEESQLIDRISTMIANRTESTMRLQLNPEELGRIRVEVRQLGANEIAVRFVASESVTSDLLRKNQVALQSRMEALNIQVREMTVIHHHDRHESGQARQQTSDQQQSDNRPNHLEWSRSEDDETDERAGWAWQMWLEQLESRR